MSDESSDWARQVRKDWSAAVRRWRADGLDDVLAQEMAETVVGSQVERGPHMIAAKAAAFDLLLEAFHRVHRDCPPDSAALAALAMNDGLVREGCNAAFDELTRIRPNDENEGGADATATT